MKFLKAMQGREIEDFPKLFEELKLPKEMQDCILQSLALAENSSEMKNADRINKALKLFISSLGRFCEEALIYPLYGSGEIPQGFCRSAAVHGGIYILRWNMKKLLIKDNCFTGAITPAGQTIKAKYCLGSLNYFNNVKLTDEGIHRCTIISDKSIISLDDLALTIIPADRFKNPNAIRILSVNSTSKTINGSFYMHHFWVKFSNK
eukprot:UN26936